MVYCGAPSKACGACRAKRTKCDQAIPTCGQCRRARRGCPGYRDAQDLVFRNETQHVVSKAQASKTSATRSGDRAVPPFKWIDRSKYSSFDFNAYALLDNSTRVEDAWSLYNFSPSRELATSLEDQGSSFFFYHYATMGNTPPNSYSAFLPKLYNQVSVSDFAVNPLPGVITAIGMAGISNLQKSPDPTTMVATRQKHTSVLRTLNIALQDPRTARIDSTILAVMLLGTYETVTCNSPQSLKIWANHVDGATAIALIRGVKQVETEPGRHIFAHLRAQIMIDCFQRRRTVPHKILEWAELAAQRDGGVVAKRENQLYQIIARLCALRSVYDPHGDCHDPIVVTLAKDIDIDLANFANDFPVSSQYTSKDCEISEDVLSDYYHLYPNTWVVGAYNLYRVARILTNEVLLNWYLHNPAYINGQLQRRQCETVLARLNADICASVPFALGDVEDAVSLPRASAGIALMWPLYLVATMDGGLDSTRSWAITRLEKLGHKMGIQQAISLANVLKSKRVITAWQRFEETRVEEELSDW